MPSGDERRKVSRHPVAPALAAILVLTSGCSMATPYHREGGFHSGGYSDAKLMDGVFNVCARTNQHTLWRDTSRQYALRRAAEITLEEGHRYFAIATRDNRQTLFPELTDPMLATALPCRYERDCNHYACGYVFRVLPSKEGIPDAMDALKAIRDTDILAEGRLSSKARRRVRTLERADQP